MKNFIKLAYFLILFLSGAWNCKSMENFSPLNQNSSPFQKIEKTPVTGPEKISKNSVFLQEHQVKSESSISNQTSATLSETLPTLRLIFFQEEQFSNNPFFLIKKQLEMLSSNVHEVLNEIKEFT